MLLISGQLRCSIAKQGLPEVLVQEFDAHLTMTFRRVLVSLVPHSKEHGDHRMKATSKGHKSALEIKQPQANYANT